MSEENEKRKDEGSQTREARSLSVQ